MDTNRSPDDCFVSVLTPPGRSAVATVSIVGGRAMAHVSELFHPAGAIPLRQIPSGRIVFGRWDVGHGKGEELIVCRRGHDVVDVHCHGGRTARRRIVDSLVAVGCREIEWQTMAFLCEETPIRAEARVALAAARTARTAAILLAQYRGALEAALLGIIASLEKGEIHAAADRLRQLDRRADFGKHLTNPWRVVFTGLANVGKSSLINAILGYERAIVFEEPGTTRDVVTAKTAIDGWPVELADTAGLRKGGDAIESTGVALARERLSTADVVVVVFDSTEPWSAEVASMANAWPDALVVHNKCDLVLAPAVGRPNGVDLSGTSVSGKALATGNSQSSPRLTPAASASPLTKSTPFDDRPVGLCTSALTGQGIADLVRILGVKLVPDAPHPDTAVPFTDRQTDAIKHAIRSLDNGRLDEALRTITGLLEVQPPNALPARNL